LYAALVAGSNQVILGHRTPAGWFTDAVASSTINAGTDYTLLVAMDQKVVSVVLNGKTVLNYTYNIRANAGSLGLLAMGGAANFDDVTLRGDDQAYAGGGAPQLAAGTAPVSTASATALTVNELSAIFQAAIQRWAAGGLSPAGAAALADVSFG